MKRKKAFKKHPSQRSPQVENILLSNRNELGQTSPALEAALAIVGPQPKTRAININTAEGVVQAFIFNRGKINVLWAPKVSLEALFSHAAHLGVDWVFSWNLGIERAAILAPAALAKDLSFERAIHRDR